MQKPLENLLTAKMMNLKEEKVNVKKLLLLLVLIVMIFTLASCNDAQIVSYHIDENGKLIATLDDETTIGLGSLSDTIANGADKIEKSF